MNNRTSKSFLVHFSRHHKYRQFCLPEFEAVAKMVCGIRAKELYCYHNPREEIDVIKDPLIRVNLPDRKAAEKILQRTVLVKDIMSVLSHSTSSYDDLVSNVHRFHLQDILDQKKSFKFIVEGVNFAMGRSLQLEVINKFGCLPFNQALIDLQASEQ